MVKVLIVRFLNASAHSLCPFSTSGRRARRLHSTAMGIGEAIRAVAANQPLMPSSLRDCLVCSPEDGELKVGGG